MELPPSFYFLRPGWWAVHVVGPFALFAAGVGLGIFHATGHGAPGAHAGHAGHSAPDPHAGHSAPDPHAGHAGHGAPPPPITGNPLRDEMIDLQVAYDKLNAGLMRGETAGIAEAFHAVHARREATVAALKGGAVRPPRNGDQLEAFVARDDAFHALVESTVDAANRGDLSALRARATQLSESCYACHDAFRDGEPATPTEERK